jgi:hypothetical protein
MLSSQPDHRDYAAASVARHAVQIHSRYKMRDGFMTFVLTPVGPLAPLGMLTGSIQGLPAHGLWPVNRWPAPKSRSSRRPRFGTKQSNLISAVSGASRAVCDLMGTLQQQTQRKPAMVILTTMVRVTMPAARRLRATEGSTPLLSPVDPDAEPGRGRYAECY